MKSLHQSQKYVRNVPEGYGDINANPEKYYGKLVDLIQHIFENRLKTFDKKVYDKTLDQLGCIFLYTSSNKNAFHVVSVLWKTQ